MISSVFMFHTDGAGMIIGFGKIIYHVIVKIWNRFSVSKINSMAILIHFSYPF